MDALTYTDFSIYTYLTYVYVYPERNQNMNTNILGEVKTFLSNGYLKNICISLHPENYK